MPPNPPSPLSPSSSKAGSDKDVDEAAQRKKKNADAQAAFRARRANYIATLEETVTNLEKVVVTLQASCREANENAAKLQAENARLHSEARDREKFWRALWQARKTGMPPDPTDAACLPSYAQSHPSPASSSSSGSGLLSPPAPSVADQHQDGRLRYAGNPSATLVASSQPYVLSSDYPQHSPALGCATATATSMTGQAEPMRSSDPGAYPGCAPYIGDDASREDSWSSSDVYPGQDCKTMDGTPSPTFVESPTATASELTYNTQYSASVYPAVVEATYTSEQSLYLFSPSRSVSPALTQASTTSSTSLSATSSSLPPYQFTFPEGTTLQDHPHFAFRQQFTIRGGQANINAAETPGNALRHKLASRQSLSTPAPTSPPYTPHDGPNYHEDDNYRCSAMLPAGTAQYRRNTAPETASKAPASRTPSPGPHISGTLAIIKAQTFGALRRTRGRTKTSSEGLAKAAVQALATQGLGLGLVNGPPNKRPRLHGGANGSQS